MTHDIRNSLCYSEYIIPITIPATWQSGYSRRPKWT